MEGGNLDITNGGSHLTIDFFIQGNNLSNNGINGALFQSSGDADFRITLGGADGAQNIINGNSQDGVNATTEAFSQIEGTWQNNIIEQNGRFGVSFTDNDQTGPAFNVSLISNLIEHNVSDGINFQTVPIIPLAGGSSTITIETNTIKANGGNGINIEPGFDPTTGRGGSSVVNVNILDNLITANSLDGIQLLAQGQSVINATVSGNTITNNGGDGVNMTTQLGTDATDTASTRAGNGLIAATFTDNIVSFNRGHGFAILSQWNGEIDAVIQGTVNPNTVGPAAATNIVDGNGLDGILVQNFTDDTRSQNDPLNYFGVTSTAPAFASPVIRLTINQTEISGNGSLATTPDDGNGIFIEAGTSQFGFINALVTNNHFSGNAHIDFVTQSVTTTANPTVTNLFNSPTGSNPTINAAFQPDPVARLALTLTGNVGNTIDVTRLGAAYPPFVNPVTDANKTTPGLYDDPFVGGLYQFTTADQNRFRNAQREPGVFNQNYPGAPLADSIDGGALILGGIWGTFAHNASLTTPDTAGAASTNTNIVTTNGIIINNGDYASPNSVLQVLGGPDAGEIRVISSSTTTAPSALTVTPAFNAPSPEPAGNQFTVTAYEQAGVGQSTFVTDSGPSVQTFNHFGTVISDFGTQISFAGGPNNTGPFTYTWQTFAPGFFGSPFP
jgi:trimeric autotransporter adhesin